MKKHNFRWSTVFFVLLMLAGVGILFYPTLCDRYMRWRLSREIGQYNQVLAGEAEDYSELWREAEEYNRYLTQKESQFMVDEEERERISTLLNPLGTGMMGQIRIPKIQVDLPVYQGTNEKELQSGAGWWIGSSLPTGGESTHCIITAHTGLVKAKMFTDVDQLVIGDIFTLEVLDRKLYYEVDQILVTEPEDMSELSIKEGEDYVTLYTCTPYGINTHRLLVRGKRIFPDEETEAAADANGNWSAGQWIAIGCAGVGILLGLLLMRLRRKKNQKKEGNES